MIALGLDNVHEDVALVIEVLKPPIEDNLLSECPDLLDLQIHLLPVPLAPLPEDSIEPPEGGCPLKLSDP